MDERLDYSSEEQLRRDSSDWQFGQDAAGFSIERESSTLLLQYRDYHLHIVQKKKEVSERPIIPATPAERMSFYRHYFSSSHKTEIVPMQYINFNRYLWNYLLGVLFYSLSQTYTQLFLASYTPEQHMFVANMVPLMYGIKFAIVITTLFEILTYVIHDIQIVAYLLNGLIFRNPWNRCDLFQNITYYSKAYKRDIVLKCYTVEELASRFLSLKYNNTRSAGRYPNLTWHFEKLNHVTNDGEILKYPQYIYWRMLVNETPFIIFSIYSMTIWLCAGLCYRLVYKRRFWKTLNWIQWLAIGMEIVSFIYMFLGSFYLENIKEELIIQENMLVSRKVLHADYNLLTQSITAPPLVHILTARSQQEIEPEADSAIIVLSNALLYLFRGVLSYKLKQYCEFMIGVYIIEDVYNSRAWFYYWPMFFSSFYLGDMYTIVFLFLHLALDFLTVVIVYHSLVEIIVWEWKWVKPWMVQIFLTVVSCLIFNMVQKWQNQVWYKVLCKALVSFFEVVAIYCMYPVGRLKDDITFHTGAPPTTLRVLSFKLMPVFYFAKIYLLMYYSIPSRWRRSKKIRKYVAVAISTPYILGVFIVIYHFVWSENGGWRRLMVPNSDWGPRDYMTRQLRKLYNAGTYIGPAAPRELSRYMITKSEAKSFQLDLQYDPQRRSTLPTSMYRLNTVEKTED